MDMSRYASRLAASTLPTSGKAPQPGNAEAKTDDSIAVTASAYPPSRDIVHELREEPEDAKITGGTRSLSRRLLALNIPTFPPVHPARAGVARATAPAWKASA